MKKIAILVLFVLLAAQFVTAGGGQAAPAVPGPASAGKPAHVNLIFTMWGDEPEAMSSVLAEFEKRTADTLNTSIKILWTPQADYANKLRLMLSAGEQIDSCFDAAWITLADFASRGVYTSLDDYFNNPQYPGLLNFDNEILQNNMYTSAVGTHIYAIPLMQALGGAVNGYMIRKDLREKYGLPPIQSYDDLEKFYDMVLKNEPGMVPMAANSAGGPWQDTPTYPDQQSNPDSRYWQVPVGSGMFGIAELAPDRKTVSNFYMVGDPRLVQGKWFNQDIFLKARDWYVKGYVDKDIQSKTPADMQNAFTSGRAASLREGTPNYTVRKNALLKAVPGAQVEFWVYTSDKIRNMEPHAMKTNFLAANYQCIPVTSKYVDRTMNFYNWLFLTQDNHDLFEYGIEGTHWQAQGADKYTVPAGAAPYTFNGYKLTWNSKYIRYPADLEPDIFNYMKYTQDINSFYVEAFAGFTPNTEPYRTEMARVLPVQQEAQNTSITGVNADPKAALDGYYAKMVDLGLPKIYDEMIKQLNAFLAAKK